MNFLTPGGMIDKNLTRLLILVIFGCVTFIVVIGVDVFVGTYFPDVEKKYLEPIFDILVSRKHSNPILNWLIALIEIIGFGVPVYLFLKIIKKSPL
jgi:hypothetical protein